jgi:TRAP-type C4-dicarboxylate transport system substrate-binding protein
MKINHAHRQTFKPVDDAPANVVQSTSADNPIAAQSPTTSATNRYHHSIPAPLRWMNSGIFKRLVSLLLVLLVANTPGYAKTFKIATLAPAGAPWMIAIKNGASEISRKTDGRVRLKFYPGGVMGDEKSVHRKIKAGQLHGGAFSSGGLAHLYPDIQILNLPMIFASFEEVDYVRAEMEPFMKQQLEARGFVLLGIAEGGFAKIISKAPMNNLEAIRASKLWSPEGDVMVEETYRTMGLSPISLPISDVFTGLKTGLIETLAVNPSSAIAFQWHNDTSYMTDVPLIYLVAILAIQKAAFDEISPTDQQIVRDEIAEVNRKMDQRVRSANLNASRVLVERGFTIVTPQAAEIERWRSLSTQAIDHLVARGVISRGALTNLQTILQEYRSRH